MMIRWMMLVLVTLSFALPLAGCGKKPRDVKSPEDTTTFPTQYPTSR